MGVTNFAGAMVAIALLAGTAADPATDTRTLGPPTVVDPFTSADVPAQVLPADPLVDLPAPAPEPEQLPPGPANRLP